MPLEGDAGGALGPAGRALQHQPGDMRIGDHVQVRTPPRGIQIGLFRRIPHAVLLRDLIGGESLLAGTVIVGVVRIAAVLRRLDQ